MIDINNGEWMCHRCKKAWKENHYNVIVLCDSCISKREHLFKGGGKI